MAESNNFRLPQCLIRSAREDDRWMLQRFVLGLVRTEALGFDLRLTAYRLLRVMILLLAACLGAWLLVQTRSLIWRSVLMALIVYAALWAVISLGAGFLYLVLIPVEPLFNWSLYHIVEFDGLLVGCAALTTCGDFAVLYHLYIADPYRRKTLASQLVDVLVRETAHPIYLVCKPKLVSFYARLGFVPVPWEQLSKATQLHFQDFDRDRTISQVQWQVMCSSQHQYNAQHSTVR